MLDLYNTLEELRYPEVAQINFEEFEASILTESKRVELLNWILQDNQDSLNKFKEPTLEGKLFKCYSQMGFCSKDDVLLGNCKIEEQLDFLSLLTLLIKTTCSVKIESLKNDKESANNLLKAEIENKSPNIKCTDVDTNKNETTLCSDSESIKLTENLIEKRRSDFETLFSDMKENLEESNKYQNDNYESTLQEFDKSFQNVTSIPNENLPNDKPNDHHNLDTHIEKMHATFSSINKALINRVEFKNRVTPENREKIANPLSSIISDTVVTIEQACNMLEGNQLENNEDNL